MINFETISGAIGTAAKAVGIFTAAGTAYVALGLPIPATVSYVDGKIETVVEAVADVKATVLEGQLRDISSQRTLLRSERSVIARSIEKAPDDAREVFSRRIQEIDDALTKLVREEDFVTAALKGGKEGKAQ